MPAKSIDFINQNKESALLRKKNLKRINNVKELFVLINNHLYAKLKYTDTDTRARSKEIVNLLFCKLIDEINKTDDDFVEICVRNNESEQELLSRIQNFFMHNVKKRYNNIFGEQEQITLNKEMVYLIVKEIQHISLLKSSKDILSDAFEIFVSKILKDEAGQFFTPTNVIRFMVNYLDPEIDSKILDPACGHGGFLLESKEHLWKKIISKYKNQKEIIDFKKKELISNLYGIDKDLFLAKISKFYLEILSGGKSNIFCEDSLDPKSYRLEARESIIEDSFDFIFTNPPFGAKIPINDKEILKNYNFGNNWKAISDNEWEKHTTIVKQQPPQILFIERCVQLLKEGGKLGIVLPEGVFGNPTDRYIWYFLKQKGKILGIISLHQNTFQPFTCNKTSILFFQKQSEILNDYEIDLAIVDNVGHDKDGKIQYKLNKDGSKKLDEEGNLIINDDLFDLHLKLRNAEKFDYLKDQKVFRIKFNQIKSEIFIPNYYTGVEKELKRHAMDKSFELRTIKDLINKKIIYTNKGGYLPRGDEIGSQVYGLGDIPFIRTSEISDWSINLDPHKNTSEEVYMQYKEKQNIEVGDILLVKDGGPNLIGKTALITELDTKIIIQSHLFQIKILHNNESIDPFLLLYLLNLDVVQKQIQAITFIQGTIATIGNRILDIILPIPSDINKKIEISNYIKKIIETKTHIRKLIHNISLDTFFN